MVVSPSPCQKHEETFLWYWLWEPSWDSGSKTDRSLPHLPWVLNSQTCSSWASSSWSVTVSVFLPWYWFPQRLLLVVFAPVSCDFPYSPVCHSNLGGSSFSCDFTSLMDLRFVELSVFSCLYLLSELSNDFQAFTVPGQKPEISDTLSIFSLHKDPVHGLLWSL